MLITDFWDYTNEQILAAFPNYSRAMDFFQDKRVIVLGAGGYFGRWATLVSANLQAFNRGKQGRVFAVTAHGSMESVFQNETSASRNVHWLFPGTTMAREAMSTADVVLDFRLPKTSTNRIGQATQLIQFQSNLLEVATRTKRGALLMIPSSGAVYGNHRKGTNGLVESDSKGASDRSVYGSSKVLSEKLSNEAFRNKNILTPRIFSSLGPMIRKDSPLIMNSFLMQAYTQRKVLCTAGRNVFRDFASPIDIVLQILSLMSRPQRSSNCINVGTPNVLSVQDFAIKVCESSSSELVLSDSQPGYEDYYFPDLTKLTQELGPLQSIPFEQTLDLTQKFWSMTSAS
jgi:nucleoside-diphosphate-sugar epimerase